VLAKSGGSGRSSCVEQRARETSGGAGEKSGAMWLSGNALHQLEEELAAKKID